MGITYVYYDNSIDCERKMISSTMPHIFAERRAYTVILVIIIRNDILSQHYLPFLIYSNFQLFRGTRTYTYIPTCMRSLRDKYDSPRRIFSAIVFPIGRFGFRQFPILYSYII